MYCITYSLSNASFNHPVNNSNSALAFFKQACHAKPGADKK